MGKRKKKGYWTYEKCKEVCESYTYLSDFYNNENVAYVIIKKRGWDKLLDILKCADNMKPRNYWTYEKCKEAAMSHKHKVDMKKEYPVAYRKINKNKWYELFEHMIPLGNKYKRMIYVFEFSDNHFYVGLTSNIIKRTKQHLDFDKNSSVYKHIEKTKLVPNIIYKTQYIDYKEAIKKEEETLNEYLRNNWNTLNISKTGALGTTSDDMVKSIRTKTIKYKSKNKISKSPLSKHNNLVKIENWDFLSNMKKYRKPNGYWDKKLCEKLCKECKIPNDLRKKYPTAYRRCLKNNWLDEFFPNRRIKKPNGYWDNKELCEKEASKYKSIREFCQKNSSAYKYSRENGWLSSFFSQ